MWNFSEYGDANTMNHTPVSFCLPLSHMHFHLTRWQHTHQVIHRDALPLSPALSSPHSHTRRTNSHSCSLPELEPHVLAGHVPRLVVSTFCTPVLV